MQEALLRLFELCIASQRRYKGGRSKRKEVRLIGGKCPG